MSFWCFFCSTNYYRSLKVLFKYSIDSFHIKVIKQWGLDVRPLALLSDFLLFKEIVWKPDFLLTQLLSRADVFIPCHGFNFSHGFVRIFESLYKYELNLKRKFWCLRFFSDEQTVRIRLVFLHNLLKKSWWHFWLLNLRDPTYTRLLRVLDTSIGKISTASLSIFLLVLCCSLWILPLGFCWASLIIGLCLPENIKASWTWCHHYWVKHGFLHWPGSSD